jgi:phage shock protein PspC (stress-responsive transcriptional regulator)
MFCAQCSYPLEEDDQFCVRCGKQAEPPGEPRAGNGRALKRAARSGRVAGVCQGFARYFDVDVTLVRLGWVGASLLPLSPGLVAYMACWALMPREKQSKGVVAPSS